MSMMTPSGPNWNNLGWSGNSGKGVRGILHDRLHLQVALHMQNIQHQQTMAHTQQVNEHAMNVEAIRTAGQIALTKQQGSDARKMASAHHKNVMAAFAEHGKAVKSQGGSMKYDKEGLSMNVNAPLAQSAPQAKGPKFRARPPKA